MLFVTGCLPPALPRVIKIGLVAPFEGRYRAVGYDAIYAARLAVREINAAGGVAGWNLELTAYDDRADPTMARAAAHNLVIDPDVIAVIGHYRQESLAAAGDVYVDAKLPLLVIGGRFTHDAATIWHLMPSPARAGAETVLAGSVNADAGVAVPFVAPYPLPEDVAGLDAWRAAYRDVGPHVPEPGLYALPTYEAIYILADAIAAAVTADGHPSRVGVASAMPDVRRSGFLGDIAWDAAGFWAGAPLYLYTQENGRVRPVEPHD